VIGLIRHEVIKALRAHGRVCAIELLASSPTAATWSLIAVECGMSDVEWADDTRREVAA